MRLQPVRPGPGAALPEHDPAVAIDAAADRMGWARALHRARERVLAGDVAPSILRPGVTDSWRRSLEAGVDPDHQLAPVSLEDEVLADRRERHPLLAVMPTVREVLGGLADEGRHLIVVADRDGCILWLEGVPQACRVAEDFHLVPGALWSEAGAGTNAVGASLATDQAIQIFAAEHIARRMTTWTCSAAPVHDPDSGEIVGSICLSSGIKAAHPYTLSLIRAAARLAEGQLRSLRAQVEERLRERYLARLGGRVDRPSALLGPSGRVLAAVPGGWITGRVELPPGGGGAVRLPHGIDAVSEPVEGGGCLLWVLPVQERRAVGEPRLSLWALGRDRAVLCLPERELVLSRRHSEIAVLLALTPKGLSGRELARELHGDGAKPVSVRAEMCRLRRRVGPWLRARPYRFSEAVRTDFGELERAGPLSCEPRSDAGPLPRSRVPAVVELRRRLQSAA